MKLKKPKAVRRRLRPEQVSIKGEIDYIIRCAARREGRVVTLGPLVFFSTDTGDAWVLDPEDTLALCLAQDGDPLPVHVRETPDNYSIEWNSMYHIEDDLFTVAERSGRVRTIMGYPTQQILRMMREMGKA
jgi:hypothetical protein